MIIIINVSFILIIILKFNINKKFNNKNIFENQNLEFLWTILPILLIIFIRIISINILFLNNELKKNIINIKIFSNQWFWTYEYPIFNKNINSYLLINNFFNFLIIETDNNLILPFNYQIIASITSFDVIHSWTIPSINIKIDSIPNQINNVKFLINKSTILYGQCSEICGIYHRFIPIKLESIKLNCFIKWIIFN